MKRFTKQEILITGFVLAVLFVLTYFNLLVSLRRARDFQRRDDVNTVANAVYHFHEDFGFNPPASADGKIIACGPGGNLECQWGWDVLGDVSDPAYPPYLKPIPTDPQNQAGASYRYYSTADHFQVYASLEGKDEDEYKATIEEMGLICGTKTCNFGKGSPNTPLDKSLQEYENELREKRETINKKQ